MMLTQNISANKIALLIAAVAIVLCSGIVFAQPTTQTTTQPTTQASTQVLSPVEQSKLQGNITGARYGQLDGAEAGVKDYQLGKQMRALVWEITDLSIINKYALGNDDYTFRSEFLSAYRLNYELGYNAAYRNAAYDVNAKVRSNAALHAKPMAASEGYYYAALDLMKDRSVNWQRAYNEFLTLGTIEARYQLDRELPEYRESFVLTFQQEFKNSYIKSFSDLNVLTETQNINYHLVGMKEDTIKVDQVYGEVIAGSSSTVTNTAAVIKVPRGAIYQDTYLGLHHIQNSFGLGANGKTPVTHQVRISVANTAGKVKLNKPLELVFDYDGSERAGIYEWKFNRWIYIPSTVGEDFISAQMAAGDYAGGTYVVMIDDTYELPKDVSFHWAYKDIVTAARREFLPSGVFFRPNDKITRAELADMVYELMNYRMLAPGRTIFYRDLSTVTSDNRLAVNYVLDRGIMSLDSKQRFNPKASVSYKDFQVVMKRLLFIDFKFQTVADRIRVERYTRTDFSSNVNLPIKRGEVVYTLNTFIK